MVRQWIVTPPFAGSNPVVRQFYSTYTLLKIRQSSNPLKNKLEHIEEAFYLRHKALHPPRLDLTVTPLVKEGALRKTRSSAPHILQETIQYSPLMIKRIIQSHEYLLDKFIQSEIYW